MQLTILFFLQNRNESCDKEKRFVFIYLQKNYVCYFSFKIIFNVILETTNWILNLNYVMKKICPYYGMKGISYQFFNYFVWVLFFATEDINTHVQSCVDQSF